MSNQQWDKLLQALMSKTANGVLTWKKWNHQIYQIYSVVVSGYTIGVYDYSSEQETDGGYELTIHKGVRGPDDTALVTVTDHNFPGSDGSKLKELHDVVSQRVTGLDEALREILAALGIGGGQPA